MTGKDNNCNERDDFQNNCQSESSMESVIDSIENNNQNDNSSRSPVLALKGMISFFTVFHLNVGEKEIQAADKNMALMPIIGFILGIIISVLLLILQEAGIESLPVLAALCLTMLFLLTKFLHFDGLADFGDGLVVSGDREKHIKALKDPLIGAGGLGLAFIITLLTFSLLIGIQELWPLVLIIIPLEIMVKNSTVSAAAFGNPGTGMASIQVKSTNIKSLAISSILSIIFAFMGYCLIGLICETLGLGLFLESSILADVILLILLGLITSIIVGYFMAKVSNKNFGFVNGDVLGATNEISRAIILLASLLVLSAMI